MARLTHLDAQGSAKMVDVSEKDVTERVAAASGRVTMSAATLKLIKQGSMKKGDVLSVARLAGIMAAKRTHELIPLCHPLALNKIDVDLKLKSRPPSVEITSSVKVSGRTGVEMEALTAASVAALTIYDMCKAVDREMVIGEIKLDFKSGGRSGVFKRSRPKKGKTP
ncbi:MAG TPA: cyclic pyranopterin monophosphate synthase MoaC [Alphaproteobacteria bacterium]|nr:cyclic pyranopterin monophosphate synthase MoaC [Alphaproteobacteria bacterium]